MIKPDQVTKLIAKMERFAQHLDNTKDIVTHQKINQFYYMQKNTELRLLLEQLSETEKKLAFLQNRIHLEYIAALTQWRHDVRWLTIHEMRPIL